MYTMLRKINNNDDDNSIMKESGLDGTSYQQQQHEGIALSQESQRQTCCYVLTIFELYDVLCIFVPKIILELFGSVGACWGFSETIGLRTPDTVWFWKPFSLAIGGLYLIRFCVQLQNHCKLLLSTRPIIQHSPVHTIMRTDTDVDDLGLDISFHPSSNNLNDMEQQPV